MNTLAENIESPRRLLQAKCKHCKQVLFNGNIQYIEIECPKCHKLQNSAKE